METRAPPPPLWKRSVKIYPLRNQRSKVPTRAPLQKLPKFSFPLKKKPIFSEPLGNIQKVKGADAATPSEMTIKGPSENLFHRGGGVDIKWNGPMLLRPNKMAGGLNCTHDAFPESSIQSLATLTGSVFFFSSEII